MEISTAYPPNYDEICLHFPEVPNLRPIFAWGGTIHNPFGCAIDRHLTAHEALHGEVQHPAAGGPEAWWRRYLDDPEFRLDQELAAYRLQLASFSRGCRSRELVHRYAFVLAGHLSSPLYGGLLAQPTAMRMLRQ